ncbi:hypothetical protein VCHENC02_5956, partial [Vibrio harveyi]
MFGEERNRANREVVR